MEHNSTLKIQVIVFFETLVLIPEDVNLHFTSESFPVYICALPDLSLVEVQVVYICTRAIQKVGFPILFLLKGFLHQVGKHEFY